VNSPQAEWFAFIAVMAIIAAMLLVFWWAW